MTFSTNTPINRAGRIIPFVDTCTDVFVFIKLSQFNLLVYNATILRTHDPVNKSVGSNNPVTSHKVMWVQYLATAEFE